MRGWVGEGMLEGVDEGGERYLPTTANWRACLLWLW